MTADQKRVVFELLLLSSTKLKEATKAREHGQIETAIKLTIESQDKIVEVINTLLLAIK